MSWWARQDSNLQPSGYEPLALTIELRARRRLWKLAGGRRAYNAALPQGDPVARRRSSRSAVREARRGGIEKADTPSGTVAKSDCVKLSCLIDSQTIHLRERLCYG